MNKPEYLFRWKKLSGIINPNQKIVLFLDFDGTLTPIRKDPKKCFLTPEIKKQLQTLVNSGNCYVSVLSGRKLSDIRKRVGIRRIYYGGNHGVNISGPGMRCIHPEALSARPVLINIKRLLRKELADIKGVWLEDKKFTLTLHFRAVEKGDISSVKKAFYKIAKRFLEGKLLTVIKGKKVLELTPDLSWDKGKAALLILKAMKDKCFPVYVGDDQTDETAFKALRNKGVTIRVGKLKKTFADYYIKGYWEISRLLQRVHESI